jgi:outer membrane protein assembly factor BamB
VLRVTVRENHATRVKNTRTPAGNISAAAQTVGISLPASWQERCYNGLMTLCSDKVGSTHFTRNGCSGRIASWVLLATVSLGFPKLSAQTSLVAWGHNAFGQTNVPVAVTDAVAISASAGGDHTLALRGTGEVVAWGAHEVGQATVPEGLADVVAISAGGTDSLALTREGLVVAWGSNGAGEGAIPPGLNNVSAIASGCYHHLALRKDGTVVAWGHNLDGQATVPPGLNRVRAIAGGSDHSLALRADGTVVGWGNNSFGQVSIPPVLARVVTIAAGAYHNLALRDDGTVVAWGRNDFGEADVPPGLADVVEIAAGESYSLALRGDGTVAFWGSNFWELSGATAGLSNVIAITAGTRHCVALVNDGSPVILGQPSGSTVYEGSGALLSVRVVGEPPLSYQWQRDGIDIPEATSAMLILDAVQTADAGDFSVVVGNVRGSVRSERASLRVIAVAGAPFILSQPCDVQTPAGAAAVFAVEANGEAPLLYQWYFEGDRIEWATQEILTIPTVTGADVGRYSVEVSNSSGGVRSAEAALSLVSNPAWVFQTGRYVFSSPAIAQDGGLYIGSADGNLYALTPEGTHRWTFVTGAEVQSSPAIGPDGEIYVGSGDGCLYALNTDGSERWRFKTQDLILSSPALGADGTVYINSRDGHLYAVAPDGTEQWRFSTGEYYNDMAPVIGPDATVYVGAGGMVRAVRQDGTPQWKTAVGGSVGNVSVVVGQQGRIYAASGGFGMSLVALTHGGRLLWRFPFGEPTAMVNPSYPAIGPDGTLYMAASDGYFYAICVDGTLRWKVPATRMQSSPALSSDGRLYLNSDDDFRVLCYDTQGEKLWHFLLGGNGSSGLMSSSPTLFRGRLYFGSGNGSVYAYNVTGELAEAGWPALGKDVRHSGRDIQRALSVAVSPADMAGRLEFVIEPDRSYRLQGSDDLKTWADCQTIVNTTARVSIARPSSHRFFRLVTP